ncbi:MAG: T9SS type A sorting domain-containing protein [candidate division Zixibacteria bacterium]|nr:T9SS type A sorting domain-containing protein [candidate division Zixibacteria bacterium]
METGEDFWLQYYNGSAWQTIGSWAQGADFSNRTFYQVTVTISNSNYTFPTNARLRFMCDASNDQDDVYIDEITWSAGSSGMSGLSRITNLSGMIALAVPDDYSLSQNYPNPFNPSTAVKFSLPASSDISLEVYNVLGQRVAVLAEGHFEAGEHEVTWDATGQASGMYFYRLTADEYVETKKMILLK